MVKAELVWFITVRTHAHIIPKNIKFTVCSHFSNHTSIIDYLQSLLIQAKYNHRGFMKLRKTPDRNLPSGTAVIISTINMVIVDFALLPLEKTHSSK